MQDRPQLGGEIVQQASTKLQKLAARKSLQSRDHRERSWPRLALELLQFGTSQVLMLEDRNGDIEE